MADETASTLPRGRFVILPWDVAIANFATLEEALSLAQREHGASPTSKFVIAQIVASVEPVTTSSVTFHRF